jgi:hypothetical protein
LEFDDDDDQEESMDWGDDLESKGKGDQNA